MNITIHRDGQNFGPYTLDQVKEYLAAGQLQLSDMAFFEGATEWTPLAKVPGLNSAPLPPSPTPPPPPATSLKQNVNTPAKSTGWLAKGCGGCFALILVLFALVVAIGVIGGKASKNTNQNTTASAGTGTDSAPAANPKVGETVKTDKLEITLESVSLRDSVGSDMFTSKAAEGGIYVVVSWSYKNISTQPITMWSTPTLSLLDAAGVEYSNDTGASASFATETKNDSKVLSDLNPGIKVKDSKVFEISKESAAKAGWKIKISAGDDIIYDIDLATSNTPTQNNVSQAASSTDNSANQAPSTPNPNQPVNNQPAASPTPDQSAKSLAKVGDTVKTQALEITLNSLAVRGSVGSDFTKSTAADGGMYVAIKWSYKNISTQPIDSMSTPSIKMVDGSGVEYSSDVGASGSYASELSIDAKVISDLSPGIKVTDADVFEISKDSLAKPGRKVKISGDQDVLFQVDLSGANTESMSNPVTAPSPAPTPASNTDVVSPPPTPPQPPEAIPPADTTAVPTPSSPAETVSSPLASEIVGSWQGSRHTDTYLADGRFGIDVDTTGEYLGRWSIAGNTLTTTYGQDNRTSVYSNVTITDTALSFDFQGHRFTEKRVADTSPPSTDKTAPNQIVAPSVSPGDSNASHVGKNFTNSIGMEMVWVAPLKCWVGKYDVTQEEYEKLTGKNPSSYQGAHRPVDSVSWVEAVAYARKLTAKEKDAGTLPSGYQYSLPTDAQYDVYVGDATLSDAVTSLDGVRNSTAEVGSKGANSYGLYDTRGNVWQWCQEWFQADMNSSDLRSNYSALTDDGGGQKFKVLRGGSWGSDPSDYFLTSFHSYNVPQIRRDRNGFRVVLESYGQ